jgi:isopenicillin-N epimerase
MFQSFQADFSKYKDPSFINLNNGTSALCPAVVIDQQKAELEIFERNTSWGLGSSWSRIWKIQEGLGDFLGASPGDLFLRPNVTLALNEIIMGLPLPPGSEILSTNFEYGAVINILKYKASKEGHSLRIENIDFMYQDISIKDAVAALIKLTSPKTRVLLISHIFTGNGIEVPLKFLAQKLQEKGILLVVDGAHAPGLIDLDFTHDLAQVDYYAGNLHKWFMGPKGTAFGWVNPKHQAKTQPLYASWTTETDVPPAMQEYATHGEFATRMLWSHSQSFSSHYGLESCLDFWKTHSKKTIFQEIQNRMNYLENELQALGLKPIKSLQTETKSRLLCFKLADFPKISLADLVIKSKHIDLQVGLPRAPGNALLRLTPHIHNSHDELKHAVQILRETI